MHTRVTAKLLLFAFVANASVCPCASAMVEQPVEPLVSATGAAKPANHTAHATTDTQASTANHIDEDCHTESPAEECGMAVGLDVDGGIDRADLTAAATQHVSATLADARRPGSAVYSLLRVWRPPDTPISTFDRLLT